MTTQEKIEAIKLAIKNADNLSSKMDEKAWSVPALSSLRIRHLMNNLGAISNRYLECGVHRGGLFCSTLRNNSHIDMACYIDSFESDKITGEDIAHEFLNNATDCLEGTDMLLFGHECDTFSAPSNIGDGIDLYLYDADHSKESQRKAVTYFLPAMADEFIFCVDDFDWPDVAFGTGVGIGEALKNKEIQVLYTHAMTGNDHDNDGWWNGFFVALLKKVK